MSYNLQNPKCNRVTKLSIKCRKVIKHGLKLRGIDCVINSGQYESSESRSRSGIPTLDPDRKHSKLSRESRKCQIKNLILFDFDKKKLQNSQN